MPEGVSGQPPPDDVPDDVPGGARSWARLCHQGDLDVDSIPRFRDAAFTLIGGQPRSLLIDLSCVPFVDTAGLATLVTIARVAKMLHIAVAVKPAAHLCRVLRTTGLTRVLPIAGETVAGFEEEPPA